MQAQNGDLTGYDVLQVHPAAPLDLITAAYWRLAGRAQAERTGSQPAASTTLWMLTRAYEVLSRPSSRAAHDQHYGISQQVLAPRVPSRRKGGRLFKRRALPENGDPNVDYYEILRVTPVAEQAVIEDAYSVLRTLYIRLVKTGREPQELIDCLEEAWAITSDVERRRKYDEARERRNGGMLRQTQANRGNGKASDQVAGEAPTALRGSELRGKVASRRAGRKADDSPLQSAGGVPETSSEEPSPERFKGAAAIGQAAPLPGPTPEHRDSADPPTTSSGRVFPSADAGRAGPTAGSAPKVGLWREVTGAASNLMRTVSRQWKMMSMREMEQVHKAAATHDDEWIADGVEEDVLVRRLSSESIPAQDPLGPEGNPATAKLVSVEGHGRVESYELCRLPLTLGGGEDCDIVLPGLAEQRARLLYRDGRFVIYNLAGLEGSEGDPDSAKWWILESGDDLRLGPYTLRFTARVD